MLLSQTFLVFPSVIDLALREFIHNHKRKDLRELQGKVKSAADYGYKNLRTEVDHF